MIEYMDTPLEGYRPGVCNIGPAEIARRRRVGYLGLAGAVGLGAFLLAIDAPAASRLLIAAPVAGGLSGFIQARLRFCAGFGWAGVRNLGALGTTEAVEDAEARAADRRMSLQIYAMAVAGGLLAGATFALLPI